jgi:hypothetical protein
LSSIAREVLQERVSGKQPVRIDDLAHAFKTRVETHLSRLTIHDIFFLRELAAKAGGTNVFNAYFAGQDADATFRMFCVTCFASTATNAGKLHAQLMFTATEENRAGRQQILFLGANRVFGEGMNDPAAPLAPLMKQMKTSNALVAEPTAAALLAAGIREYGDGVESAVGYPIFVYALDAGGFRKTRTVGKGQAVTFDAALQGK